VRRRSHRATLGILCALVLCAPLSIEARAAASSEDGSASGAAARRVNDGQSIQMGLAKGGESKARNAVAADLPSHGSVRSQRGVGRLARSNADRLHSLLSAEGRGGTPRASSHVRSTGGTTGNRVVGAQRSANPAARSTLPVSKLAARAAPGTRTTANAVGINSRIGGLHATGPGRLGGPTIGGAANNAAIDGAQMRRKF
jgi:hypothetical protein